MAKEITLRQVEKIARQLELGDMIEILFSPKIKDESLLETIREINNQRPPLEGVTYFRAEDKLKLYCTIEF